MDENGIVIRKTKAYSIPFIALLGLFIVVVIFGCIFKAHDWTEVLGGVLIITVMAAVMVYILKHRLKQDVVDLAISPKGVYLNGKGLYPWSLIEHFSTTEHHDDGVTMKLTLHFSQYDDEDFDITHLDIGLEELVGHMLYYKGTFAARYAGHTKE